MPLVDPVTMSTATKTKPSPSTTSSRGAVAAAAAKSTHIPPIPLLDTPLARPVAHGRPIALAALLYLGMGRLIEDPVWALQVSLPAVAAVQTVYVGCCIPVAGSQIKSSSRIKPGERRKASSSHSDTTGSSVITAAALSAVLSALATPFVHLLFVLFGAPFLTHIPHTLLLSAHLSLLTAFPLFYARGIDTSALMAVAGFYAPLDETLGAVMGAGLGGWLGAVPIPLDWDREWQKWPVTIVVGVYVGSLVGAKVAGGLFWGRRMGVEVKTD